MPLRVVLATEKAGYMAPVIPALVGVGATIVAHVAPPRAWRRRHFGNWRYAPVLRRHAPACRILPFADAGDWPGIIAALEPLAPDLIVSAHFPYRLPGPVLAMARLGGVNLHPARLPWYAGARPLHAMLLNGDELRFGGMTLHCMTEVFDAGPIIGAATLDPGVWQAGSTLNSALAGAAAALCAGPLLDWINGQVTPQAQLKGAFPRARIKDLDGLDPATVTADRVAQLLRLFRKGLPIRTPDGVRYAGYMLRQLGPPTGEGPRLVAPRRLQFDCADARLEARKPGGLERRLLTLAGRVPDPRPRGQPIAPASVLSADQNADCIARMAACNPAGPGSTFST